MELSLSMDADRLARPVAAATASTLSLEQRLAQFIQTVSGRALVMMEHACQGRQDIASDLVQEALIALHQAYPHKSSADWHPLFYTILNNKLNDWRRREARRQQRFGWLRPDPLAGEDEDPIAELIDRDHVEPADALIQQLTLEQIQQAIQQLPVRQQQAFLLRAWEGFDTATTAQIMNCTTGSVKTHYHRATQALKSHLAHLQD